MSSASFVLIKDANFYSNIVKTGTLQVIQNMIWVLYHSIL